MPVDASIPLQVNPPAGPQQLMSLYQFAESLKAQRQQQEQFNALRQLAAQPDSFDEKGRPTQNFLRGLQQIDPMKAMEAYDQLAKFDEQEALASQHKAAAMKDKMEASHGIASEAIDAYDGALKSGLSTDAAKAKAQSVYTEGMDRLKKSGMFSADEVAQAPTEFDPITTRANAGKTKEWLDRQDKEAKDKAEQAFKETEFKDKQRHEKVQEGIEGARLSIERHREARETAAQADKPNLGPAAIEMTAEQVLAGDRSGLQNLGRGKQGAADLAAVRNRVAELAVARGLKGADLANIDAAFQGQLSGERTLGRRGAQLEQTGSALEGIIGLSKDAYAKLPRGQFVPFNQLRAMVDKNLSSPEQAAAFQYDEAVINAWAKSINPSGGMTVSDVKRGEDMLSKVTSVEAHDAVLDAMLKEVGKERGANVSARANLRDQGTGGAKPQTGGVIKYDANGNRVQ